MILRAELPHLITPYVYNTSALGHMFRNNGRTFQQSELVSKFRYVTWLLFNQSYLLLFCSN